MKGWAHLQHSPLARHGKWVQDWAHAQGPWLWGTDSVSLPVKQGCECLWRWR